MKCQPHRSGDKGDNLALQTGLETGDAFGVRGVPALSSEQPIAAGASNDPVNAPGDVSCLRNCLVDP